MNLNSLSYVLLTRFSKIAIQNNKFQMTSGQGSHWLIESPTILSFMYNPLLSDICQFYFLYFHTATTCGSDQWLFILHLSYVGFSLESTSACVYHTITSPTLALAVPDFSWETTPVQSIKHLHVVTEFN